MAVKFIPDEIVPIIQADLLKRYGGILGIRDRGLLSSSLAQPKTTSRKRFLHRTIFDKAAAYGFHMYRNHPYVDGDKRIAFALMDIFLHQNGWDLQASEEDAYEMMIRLASGNLPKNDLSAWLKAHSSKL